MNGSEQQRDHFRLMRQIRSHPQARRRGALFGVGYGIEEINALILRHFANDYDRVRQYGWRCEDVLVKAMNLGAITVDDMMNFMGADSWPEGEIDVENLEGGFPTGPAGARFLAVLCLEMMTGEGFSDLLEKTFKESDDRAIGVTSWRAMALARLQHADLVPSPDDPPPTPAAAPQAASQSGCGGLVAAAALGAAARLWVGRRG